MKKPTTKMYLVWDMTNYGSGFEFLGLYNTKTNATKAFKQHMKELYGTTNENKLLELREDVEGGCADSWRIDEITIND